MRQTPGIETETRATTNVETTRRSVIGAAAGGALLAAGLAGPAAQAEEVDHSAMGHTSGPAPHQKLIDAALHCVNRGEVCTNHCIKQLAAGDTSLADCMRTVQAMNATCAALARLAALQSPRLQQMAKLTIEVCSDCEAQCKKHADHHAECKACMESCQACIKECKGTLGA
jgi:Cys-rich four helix bundle protein (predicted Tat secretion target)